jgi:hypothetical protein
MTYELTNDEKRNIVNQHLRNLEYSKFNVEISLVEENADPSPNQENLDSLAGQLATINGKMEALTAELAAIVD